MDPAAASFARLDRFAELVQGEPTATPLDEAVLTISAVLRSSVDVDEAVTVLDQLAADCPSPTFEGLRRYLFEHLAFQGDDEDYDDPRNSFLDLVLARRAGLPILLAVVMIEVGRRVGVPVVGIGMPLHFLVRDGNDPDGFVDPFTGVAFDAAGAQNLFDSLSQGRVPWNDRHLRPIPARHVVIRVLTNLRTSYEHRHDDVRLALVARLRASVPELHQEAETAVRLNAVFN